MIIGQCNNLSRIDKMSADNFPHFIVFTGTAGSGKTMLAKYVANKLSATFSVCGIKVDEIREVIDTAYHVKDRVVYCVRNADTMRTEAKNAMLKITEEPPENAYFIMTVIDDSSLLDTIKSRAQVFQMEPYAQQQLDDYYMSKYSGKPKYTDIARTPYEVDILQDYGEDFIDYVELVLDNIGDVASANAFKSAEKLSIKNDEGYDLGIFWSAFINECIHRIQDDISISLDTLSQELDKYADWVCITTISMIKAQKLGVNKQQLYDDWVFKIREACA